jgi:hypothetical protein
MRGKKEQELYLGDLALAVRHQERERDSPKTRHSKSKKGDSKKENTSPTSGAIERLMSKSPV